MQYLDLEIELRAEAEAVADSGKDWTAAEVSRKLTEIADMLEIIRRQHLTGINASMGKRSGNEPDAL